MRHETDLEVIEVIQAIPTHYTVGAGRAGVGDGTALSTTGVREGKTGEQIVDLAHGKYYEAASRGVLYCGGNATARATQTALATTAPLTLYNPVGSGKYLSIKKVGFGQSGAANTLGTGGLFHCVFTIAGPIATQSNTVPSGGTVVTPKNCRADASNASVADLRENTTLAAAPVALAPFVNLSEVAALTIGGNNTNCTEDVDGAIVLTPGSGYTIQGITATGSTGLGFYGIVWEEIPIS